MASSGCRCLIAALAVILIILIIFACAGHASSRRYQDYLSGMWVGDPSFMRTAQVDDFMLFLGPQEKEAHSRAGYIRIVDDAGGVVTSRALTLREHTGASQWWPAIRSAFSKRDVVTYQAHITFDEGEGAHAPLPERASLAVSMAEGTLAIFDDKKVYAFLAKDLTTSAVALQAYTA